MRNLVRPSVLAWVWPGLVLALGALAYRPLLTGALQLPAAHQFESWLFRPSQLPSLLVVGIAGWLLWRRRERLRALPDRRHRTMTAALAVAGAALFVWALLTGSADLLLPSLAANLLAFGSAARGRAGAGALSLPSLVLLLGVQIPAPLRDEIVWHLQLATAAGSAWLLGQIGREFILEGVILRDSLHSFHVIDGCSGLQGIATLTLVAIIIHDLLAPSARRLWLLVALATALGYALNTVRIAYIAASPNPEAYAGLGGDHTPQGVALLAAGTGILYVLGRAIARGGPLAVESREAGPGAPWRLGAAWLAALAALSLVLPPFPPARAPARPSDVVFAEDGSGWVSEPLVGDPFFLGPLPGGQTLYRRYQRPGAAPPARPVEIFIGIDAETDPATSQLLSSKLVWPGPEWNLESRRRARIWVLDREAELAVAARGTGDERAVIYHWRLRDEGLWRESLRALLALESSPFRRPAPRAVVRLVAFAPWDEPLAIARAKRRLDRFVTDFREELAAL